MLIIEDPETGAVASWDSSAHENSKLNRLTPDHERLYMIVKVTLRLSDPSPCGNILQRLQSSLLIKQKTVQS